MFDRGCNVIYHQDWSRLHQQHAAATSGLSFTSSLSSTLQLVGGAGGDEDKAGVHAANKRARGDTMEGVSRHVSTDEKEVDPRLLPFDEESKLIYGVVYSLRNMVRKLGGSHETFHNISTPTYTLTHMQTPSMYTFVLITDAPPNRAEKGPSVGGTPGTSPIPGTDDMMLRAVIRELWRGPWIQFAVHHPLVHATEREALDEHQPTSRVRGIDNTALHTNVERVLAQYKLLPTM